MTKEEKLKKQKITDNLIRKWQPWLFLQEWHFDIFFAEEDFGESPTQTIASAVCNYTYKKANITFYPRFFKDSKEEQEKTVIHELCHCHTDKVWDMLLDQNNGLLHTKNSIRDEIETLTTRMENIIYLVAKNY